METWEEGRALDTKHSGHGAMVMESAVDATDWIVTEGRLDRIMDGMDIITTRWTRIWIEDTNIGKIETDGEDSAVRMRKERERRERKEREESGLGYGMFVHET